MGINLTKRSIELLEGDAGKVSRVRDGDSRLFLRIDRRSAKTLKTFYFEREFRGIKRRMKIGNFPIRSIDGARGEVK